MSLHLHVSPVEAAADAEHIAYANGLTGEEKCEVMFIFISSFLVLLRHTNSIMCRVKDNTANAISIWYFYPSFSLPSAQC